MSSLHGLNARSITCHAKCGTAPIWMSTHPFPWFASGTRRHDFYFIPATNLNQLQGISIYPLRFVLAELHIRPLESSISREITLFSSPRTFWTYVSFLSFFRVQSDIQNRTVRPSPSNGIISCGIYYYRITNKTKFIGYVFTWKYFYYYRPIRIKILAPTLSDQEYRSSKIWDAWKAVLSPFCFVPGAGNHATLGSRSTFLRTSASLPFTSAPPATHKRLCAIVTGCNHLLPSWLFAEHGQLPLRCWIEERTTNVSQLFGRELSNKRPLPNLKSTVLASWFTQL